MPYTVSSSSLGESQGSPTSEFCWDASSARLARLSTFNDCSKTEKTNYQHLHISNESDVSSRKNLWRVIMKLISVISQSHEGNVCARSNSAELFVPITGSAPNLL